MSGTGYSETELRLLTGREFNTVLANDPELARLRTHGDDHAADVRLAMEVLGLGDYRIGNLPIRPLTVGKWCFLWMLESPITSGAECSEADLNLALYVMSALDLRKLDGGFAELPALAAGYCAATGLSAREVRREIDALIMCAFRPLAYLPSTGEANGKIRYDAVWAAKAASIAAREGNICWHDCLHRVSLGTVCALYVSYFMHESADGDKVKYPVSNGCQAEIDARLLQLEREFLAEKCGEVTRRE